jgi:hypothetical protein
MLCAALAIITICSYVEASPVDDAGICLDDNLDQCGHGATEAALLQKSARRYESLDEANGNIYVYVPKGGGQSKNSGMVLVENEKDDHKALEKLHKASSDSGIGGRASLDDDGYMQVAETKDPKEMEAYTLRLISDLGLHVKNMGGVVGLLPYFDGQSEAAVQTFGKLKAEIQRNAKKKDSWVAPKAQGDKPTSSVLQKSAVQAAQEGSTHHVSGESVPLSEQGYVQLADQGDSVEMEKFVRRAAADMGLHIQDEGGLSGFAPWYSGEMDVQSLDRLQDELQNTSKNASSWVLSTSNRGRSRSRSSLLED